MNDKLPYIIATAVVLLVIAFSICGLILASRADDEMEKEQLDAELKNFIKQREELLEDGKGNV